MPRPRRVCFEGAVYHVTCRGDNREPIFLDESDYQQYLMYVLRYKAKFRFHLFCYCLMPNHTHLAIQPSPLATISRIMLCVNTRYTNYFNKRHGRLGHLFQGRFYSSLIEKDAYLLAVSRYLHLNPVRAHLCNMPEDYPWSSYLAYLSVAHDPSGLVDSDLVMSLLGAQGEPRRVYRTFVESVLSQEHSWEMELSL